MGSGIRDAAMQHSRRVYGDEYAERITAHYVSAGADIGRGALSTANVLTLGTSGLVVGAAIEGADLYFNLYDYLVGPVLLQGFVYFVNLPFPEPKKYFTVLRPWSLSLYYSPNDITQKPHKIIATSNLSTIPRIEASAPLDIEALEIEEPVDDDSPPDWWTRHVEFNTIDCSTFYLYASPFSPVTLIQWFEELKLGSQRVETIKKRMSGAGELREIRRLRLLPKTTKWQMALRSVRVVQLSPESASKKAWLAEADATIVASESSVDGTEEAESAWIVPIFVDGIETDWISDPLSASGNVATITDDAPIAVGAGGLECDTSMSTNTEKVSLWRKTKDLAKDAAVASVTSLLVKITPLTVQGKSTYVTCFLLAHKNCRNKSIRRNIRVSEEKNSKIKWRSCRRSRRST